MSRALRFAAGLLSAVSLSGGAMADVYSVTTTNDAGAGSLRQAILDANDHPGADAIHFQIPGVGLHILMPQSELPALTEPTTVSGLTEDVASCASWPPTLQVVLDGSEAGADANGLTLLGDDSIVTGLVIRRFDGYGIDVQSNENTRIRCNFIGTSAAGSSSLGNIEGGVRLLGSIDSTVGGSLESQRNLISGNGYGVSISGASNGTEVVGNYIGTNAAGTAAIANAVGVRSRSADVTIGGEAPAGGNLISGNGTAILILGPTAIGNLVFGNRIGLDAAGEPTLGNGTGIAVNAGASATLVGSTLEGLGNEIAGNTSNGVQLFNDDTTLGNTIRGNSIHENGGLGIALSGSDTEPTPNDPGDDDEGPNRLQNSPDLVSATQDGEAPIEVTYFVDSVPGDAGYPITVDFYVADADGEEGRSWIGSDEFEAADHAAGLPVVVPIFLFFLDPGPHELVATATDADGNTSEFSPAVTVPEPGGASELAAAVLVAFALTRGSRR